MYLTDHSEYSPSACSEVFDLAMSLLQLNFHLYQSEQSLAFILA